MESVSLKGKGKALGACLALSLVPALMLVLVQAARAPVPGNSVHNDPDWYYLANSLQLVAEGRAYLMEHPGLPLTVLGAAFLRVKLLLFPAAAESDYVAEVFLHSPEYHHFLGSVGLFFTVAALFTYGLVLSRRYVPLWAAVACQGLLVWAPHGLRYTGRWMPEGAAILLGAVFGIFFLGQLRERQSRFSALALGGYLGAALSIKLSFLPWGLIALTRARRHFLLCAAAAAAVFGAFLFALRPDRALLLPSYLLNLLSSRGIHGSGEKGAPGVAELLSNLAAIGREHPLSLQQLIWAVVIAAAAFFLSLRWRERRQSWVMLAGFAIVGLCLLGLAKHPGARYGLPVFVFMPSLLAAFFAIENAKWAKALTGALAFASVVSGLGMASEEYANLRAGSAAIASQEREVEAALAAQPGCLRLFQESVPSVHFSNYTGNAYTGGEFSARLNELFPRTWFLALDGRTVYNYTKWKLSHELFKGVLEDAPCVFFYVRKDLPDPSGLPLFSGRKWSKVYGNGMVELLHSE